MAIAIDMGLRITSRRFACCCGKPLTPWKFMLIEA
jgi:hypothetical protein